MLKKGQLPILIVNFTAIAVFLCIFISKQNYEFVLYIGVILFFLGVIVLTNNRIAYDNIVLWGLTLWSIMHMSGGGLYINNTKLYELILVPVVGEPYLIFKYDQLVHIFGFGVATLLMYQLIRPVLGKVKTVSVGIVVVMAGLGVGGLNEIIEFFVTVLVPESGVGGYENTALDLVSNLIGAVMAWTYIKLKL